MSKYQILREYEHNLMLIEDILKKAGTTNNIELTKLGKSIIGDLFIGVFSSNEFPKRIYEGQSFIINTQSSKQSGLHWVAFVKYHKKLYGYDSYGRDIHKLSPYFKHKRFINANSTRFESYAEKDCGERSLAFLLSFYKHGDKIINII